MLTVFQVIPDEYQKNLLSSATTYVSRREGVAEAYLSGYFTGADTVVITASKRISTSVEEIFSEPTETNSPNIKQSPREGIEDAETTTWWYVLLLLLNPVFYRTVDFFLDTNVTTMVGDNRRITIA